jgi:hypothetical protein
MTNDRWFKHEKHGYMLRRPDPVYHFDFVVTALCLNTAEEEEDKEKWERHKSRLRVNGGCGAVCVDQMHHRDHNSLFERIPRENVPAHILEDFEAALI